MEIKLQKDETIKLKYSECPMCHKSFNTGKRKKTEHHIIPLLLNPLTKITMDLCEECHGKLNKLTGQKEINSVEFNKCSTSFKKFKNTYEELQKDFYAQKIHKGQFGEGLWSNLVSFLESKEKKK